jgi:hypothetical protein
MTFRTRLIGMIVLAAAIGAPVAQAQSPDDRPGTRGPGGIAALQAQGPHHPDNRGEARGPGSVGQPAVSSAVRPDDRVGLRGPGSFDSTLPAAATHPDNRAVRGTGTVTTIVAQPTAAGFDWNDALIGGLGGVGTALLLTGCLFLLMSQRNKARVA